MLQMAANKFSHILGINSRQLQSASGKKETFISLIICCALIEQRGPAAGEKPGLAQGRCHPRKEGHGSWGARCHSPGQGAAGGARAGAEDGAALLAARPVHDPGAALRDRKAIAGQPPRERKLLLCIWRG